MRKREVSTKPSLTRMLAQFFNEDVADWTRAVMSLGMRLRRYVAKFPTSQEAGKVPATEFSANTRVPK